MLILRAIEFAMLFLVLPVGLALWPRRLNPIPILLATAAAVLIVLLNDPSFDRESLTRFPDPVHNMLRIAAPLPIVAGLMIALLYWLAPQQLFKFVRRKPRTWAGVMVVYPLVSVIPQTVIYRVFFMYRYAPLFGNGWLMIMAATVAFGLGHLIFRHPVPVLMTTVGGLIFALRYHATASAPLSAIEHAIYGDLAFTIGYSYYLYHASKRMTDRSLKV
ncbi:hypothetical protein BH10PLA1_BH10PLA1_07550 [soil metagenome]